MKENKEGKKFWYVDNFRIKKYMIIKIRGEGENKTLYGADVDRLDGVISGFDTTKICFTKEEAIEMLKRDTDKLIAELEDDL